MRRTSKHEATIVSNWAEQDTTCRGSFRAPNGKQIWYHIYDFAAAGINDVPCEDAVVAFIHDEQNYCIIASPHIPENVRTLYVAHEYYDFTRPTENIRCKDTDIYLEEVFKDRPAALHEYFTVRVAFYENMARYAEADLAKNGEKSPYTPDDPCMFREAAVYASTAANKYT